jgi:hypothetical protein
LGEAAKLGYASDNAASDPQKLRASSPVLLLGGVGITPQQRALGVYEIEIDATISAADYALVTTTIRTFIH